MKEISLFVLLFIATAGLAQKPAANFDESKVPAYTLPDLLVSQKGRKIKHVKQWEKIRRPEILHLFQEEVYGKVPGQLNISNVIVHEDHAEALEGLAVRKQVDLVFSKNGKELTLGLLIYLPRTEEKVPVFLACNFLGNHTVSADPDIRLTESWVPDHPSLGIIHNQITEQSRGVSDDRWPVEMIIKSGYGLVTFYCGDVDPDRDEFQDGIHPFFYKEDQTRPRSNEWGTIAAWAWGLSRVMDYLESDGDVNAQQVIVLGHSRLGKAALWAAASDPRFAMCISNESGCMGAALSRRKFGETVATINSNFPHWFCGKFKKYSGYEEELPVDQHMLLALIAPRPLYVSSAADDLWSDPKGEFLSAKLASAVYRLYGLPGLPVEEMPEPDTPVSGIVSYHIRSGKHDITRYDWEQYIRFADEQMKGRTETGDRTP